MVLQMALQKIIGEKGLQGERVADIMLLIGSTMALLTVLFVVILCLRSRTEEDVPRNGLYLLLGYLLVATALLVAAGGREVFKVRRQPGGHPASGVRTGVTRDT